MAVAWLLRAISYDLTTISGEDTDERVLAMCAQDGSGWRELVKLWVSKKPDIKVAGDLRLSRGSSRPRFVPPARRSGSKWQRFPRDFRRVFRRSMSVWAEIRRLCRSRSA